MMKTLSQRRFVEYASYAFNIFLAQAELRNDLPFTITTNPKRLAFGPRLNLGRRRAPWDSCNVPEAVVSSGLRFGVAKNHTQPDPAPRLPGRGFSLRSEAFVIW
jgi:hypothetical protein